MNFEESIKQIKNWCKLSKGELIEISPDNFLSFEIVKIFDDSQISSLESILKWRLPDSYKFFLKSIGKSYIFSSEYGLGTHFLGVDEILQTSETQVWESWEEEKEKFPYRYCMIGEESGLGDFFGFGIGIESTKNFDIFCHEYPPFEYIEISNELKSWRFFDEWIIQIVNSFGEERL